MKKFVAACALLALLAGTASAGWLQLAGQKAPQISAKDWINTGKVVPSNSDLRGKVWILEFFATW